MTGLLVAPGAGRTRRRRLLAGLAVLVVVAVALLAARPSVEVRRQRWVAACTAAGHAVRELPPAAHNPLLVQAGGPAYECRATDGQVLSRWR